MAEEAKISLENWGDNPGMPIKSENVFPRSTIFFDPSTTLTDKEFWSDPSLPSMYQWPNKWPDVSYAYTITAMRVWHNLTFVIAAADVALQNEYIQFFEECSFLRIKKGTSDVGNDIPFSMLTDYTWKPRDVTTTPASANFQVRDKVTFYHKLDEPIKIGKTVDFHFYAILPKTMITTAYIAAVAPYLGGFSNTNQLACTTRGHAIQLQMRGLRHSLTAKS